MSDLKELNTLREVHNYGIEILKDLNYDEPDVDKVKEQFKEAEQMYKDHSLHRDELTQESQQFEKHVMNDFGKLKNFVKLWTIIGGAIIFILFFIGIPLLANATKSFRVSTISFVVFLVIFTVYAVIGFRASMTLGAMSKHKEKLDTELQFEHFITQYIFILYTTLGLVLDKDLYKSIYEKIYNVQDWMMKNDSAGFESLVKATQELGYDLYEDISKRDDLKEEVI